MTREIVVHSGYLEIAFIGAINRAALAADGPLPANESAVLAGLQRVLFDFNRITAFDLDPYPLGRAMEQLAGRGLRLAILSDKPAMFGGGRQIAQWSHTEGTAIAVVRDRQSALRWLLDERLET